MSQKNTILLIEDELSMARVYEGYLANEPYEIQLATNGAQALAMIDERTPDLIVLDLMLPDMSGHDILRHLEQQGLPCEVVVVTGDASISTAVESMRLGASDFLVKPFTRDRLVTTLRNGIERRTLTRIVQTYRDEIDRTHYCGFIGRSLSMMP